MKTDRIIERYETLLLDISLRIRQWDLCPEHATERTALLQQIHTNIVYTPIPRIEP